MKSFCCYVSFGMSGGVFNTFVQQLCLKHAFSTENAGINSTYIFLLHVIYVYTVEQQAF